MGKSKELATLTDVGGTVDGEIDVTSGGYTARGLDLPDVGTGIGSVQLGYDGSNGVVRTWMSSPIKYQTYGTHQFETAGVNRMTIDAAGRVTMPYQPVFCGAYTGTNNGTTVVFNYSNVNVGNIYNTSTGRFTAPVDGYYRYTCVLLKASGTATRIDVVLNGSYQHYGQEASYSSTSGYDHLIINSVYHLSAGDWIDLNVVAGSLNYNTSASDQYNCLTIQLLG